MAIQTEKFFIDEREFIRTYSDANHYVIRDNVAYIEACDPSEFERVYTESDEIIPNEEDSTSELKTILNIILGEER